MAQFERPRAYPGGYGLDSGGCLAHPVDTDLWWKPLAAPGTDPSINGPVGPDRHDNDPFLDYPLPVIVAKFNLDTFELYLPCDRLDGLNLVDPRSTLGGFGGAWVARSLPLCAWENFEADNHGESLDGLGDCHQGFGGLWVARNRPFGLYGWDDFESYTPFWDVNGLNNGAGLGPMVGRSLNTPALAYDTFETYSDADEIDGLNGGGGWSNAWVGGSAVEATVKDRVCGLANDKRASLVLSLGPQYEISRKLPWGAVWQKIRIALRLQWTEDPPNEDMFNSPRLIVGLCNGDDGNLNRFASATCNNFLGVVLSDWLTYYRWYEWDIFPYNTGILKAVQKIGPTETTGATDLTDNDSCAVMLGADTPSGEAYPPRGVLFIDITKGSPTWRVQVALRAVGQLVPKGSENDVSLALLRFYEGIEYPIAPFPGGPPVMGRHFGPDRADQEFTVDEGTDGVLDTVNIALDDLYAPIGDWRIELCDVDVVKFA
jgi:hypothetical protein